MAHPRYFLFCVCLVLVSQGFSQRCQAANESSTLQLFVNSLRAMMGSPLSKEEKDGLLGQAESAMETKRKLIQAYEKYVRKPRKENWDNVESNLKIAESAFHGLEKNLRDNLQRHPSDQSTPYLQELDSGILEKERTLCILKSSSELQGSDSVALLKDLKREEKVLGKIVKDLRELGGSSKNTPK